MEVEGLKTAVDILKWRAKHQASLPAFVFHSKSYQRCVLTWEEVYSLGGRFAYILHNNGDLPNSQPDHQFYLQTEGGTVEPASEFMTQQEQVSLSRISYNLNLF